MRSLQESLAEYGETMLRAIAEQWQVAADEPAALLARLATAMLEPARLAAFVAALDDDARAALAMVAGAGGSIRGYLLTRIHGEVRRLGPRAIERETPWRHPASASERLWYGGLLFRRYGRLGAYHGEIYYIPPDLAAILPAQPAPPRALALVPVAPATALPAGGREAGDALALDVETLLGHLRRHPVPLRPEGDLPPAAFGPLGARLWGENEPERLALLQRLALEARLIVRRGGHAQVGAQTRSWLQQPGYRRQALLFRTWQRDAHWNELWRVPMLRCEETGWRNDPVAARAAILDALRQCPPGWLRLADLVAALKDTRPDFARPDGDYDSWYIRDVASGQYLSGFAHWDDVEGALIVHLITRSLYWLGAVALAGDKLPSPSSEALFRLTAWGRAFLGQAPAPAAAPPRPVAVQADLTILVPRAASAYDRVRIERFARWQGREGDSDRYRVDGESAWQAFNGGIHAHQIIAFLQRAAGGPLPAEAIRTLHAWGARYGQVTVRRALLLQTANAETLRLLRSDPELGQRLGAMVSERAILIPEDQFPAVLARLKALGYWPRLDGLES